jgi:hypothetical protein
MPERNALLGRLDVVCYYRTGGTVFFIFRHGSYSVAVTVDLSPVRRADGDDWFEARSEFQVRPVTPLTAPWSSDQAVTGYGKTEEEAMLAAVDLFTDRFDTGFRAGRVPP